MSQSGIDPPSLTLEITETMLMADVDMVCRQLRRLKKLDVGLAVDDFGTGYSSLGYLQRFPLDAIKIDRSFVEPLGRRAQQADVVRAIIDLAGTLGLRTVAEGIQRPQAITALQAMGCDAAQGNHFCEAVPECEIERLLSTSSAWAFPVAIGAAFPANN